MTLEIIILEICFTLNLYNMKFAIILTWSKIVAVLILGCAVFIDIKTASTGTVFMFSIPFIVFLITGKQFIDKNKVD